MLCVIKFACVAFKIGQWRRGTGRENKHWRIQGAGKGWPLCYWLEPSYKHVKVLHKSALFLH